MDTELKKEFAQRYGRDPLVVSAPGRINLIGEHTDYNKGFVLPGAVDKRIYAAIAKNGTQTVNVFARELGESASFEIDETARGKVWINYLLGVTYYVQQVGIAIEGVDVLIDGDIPIGAGMSSSAALCSAYGFALNELFELDFTEPCAIVMGSEDKGVFTGMQKISDGVFKIPMTGKFESLNVSVAAGMIMYEAMKQRM